MLISVSSIDNTHPAAWQRVTVRSNVLAPPLTQSCVFLPCVARVFTFVCMLVHVYSRAVFVHLSLRAELWVAGQVMAGWNYGSGLSHPHLSLCVLQCQPVSSMCWGVWLTVRFLSQDRPGECGVVHFVPGQVCTQWMQRAGVCCHDMSALWLGCTLGACIRYVQRFCPQHMRFSRRTHVCETQQDSLTLLEQW